MDLEDKKILITGGASGLGHATATYFKKIGAVPILADLPGTALEEAAAALGVSALGMDVTKSEDVSLALQSLDRLDGVVNCAGIAPAKKILGRQGPHDLELYARVVSVNLVGTFNVLRLGAEKMAVNEPNEHGERGGIVNTASVAAFEGQIGQAAYASSKGGVVSLTLVAARELASIGVRVNTIAPGIFATPMLMSLGDEVVASLEETTIFPKRLGDPEEFGKLVETCFTNPMLNAAVLRLDGALRMMP